MQKLGWMFGNTRFLALIFTHNPPQRPPLKPIQGRIAVGEPPTDHVRMMHGWFIYGQRLDELESLLHKYCGEPETGDDAIHPKWIKAIARHVTGHDDELH